MTTCDGAESGSGDQIVRFKDRHQSETWSVRRGVIPFCRNGPRNCRAKFRSSICPFRFPAMAISQSSHSVKHVLLMWCSRIAAKGSDLRQRINRSTDAARKSGLVSGDIEGVPYVVTSNVDRRKGS